MEKRKYGNPKENRGEKELSSVQAKIVIALKRCGGGDGVPSKALLREAGLRDKKAFYQALHELEELGRVKVEKDHWVKLTPEKGPAAEAVLVTLSEKFGFARPKNGGDDIFIPGSALKGAFVGDEVLVGELRQEERGPSGRIQRILRRSAQPVTGTVRVDASGARVTPDLSLRYDLLVTSPKDLGGAKDGDKVLIEPRADRRGDWVYAVVKGVFGSGQRAKVCADAIMEHSGIPREFPPQVLEEAKRIAERPIPKEEMERRLDLREEPVFTIDSAEAKDLDDAISVRKNRYGYKLGVHIADVSHYVKGKSLLDQEAFRRGTSVYFADRVIPMLPEALSNGVCSLNAGEDKLTFSALISFDKQGLMTGFEFQKTVIRSKVRGVYREVNEIFAGTASKELLKKYEPVKTSLKNAKELADLLQRNAGLRGEMELESGEIEFVLDEEGVCTDLRPRTTGQAEALIEQLMIAANIAAAKASLKAEIPFLYRIHEPPQPDRVVELAGLLDRFGIACGEIKKGQPTAKDFAAVLERAKGSPREALVSQRVLRTMEKARYSHKEVGHFGLALPDYSHFTSPIRRYPDTSIHRILSCLVNGESKESIRKRFEEFAVTSAEESSQNEVRAVTAEREAEDCYIAEYLKAHIGERHVGIISGATPRGVFVRLENGAEGFVSLEDFENCDFQFDGEITHRDLRSGRVLMVGEPLPVIIASADVATGRADFVPQEP